MNKKIPILVYGLLFTSLMTYADNWTSWRGLQSDGVSYEKTSFPTTWDREKNVKWRAELPSPGNSSPVIWEDKVFITQAVDRTHERLVMCFNRNDGQLIWKKGVIYTADEPTWKRPRNPYCSGSPVTDGTYVYATFASAGVFCFDLDGNQIWKRDLGFQHHEFGNGVSPMLYENLLILYHGPNESEKSVLYAMDKKTGDTVWKVDDPNFKAGKDREDNFRGNANGSVASFSTPAIIQVNGRDELVTAYPKWIVGLDPSSGKEYWRSGGINPLVYCSPVFFEGNVIMLGGYGGPALAVKCGGSGNVTDSHMLWRSKAKSDRLSTGVIKGNYHYSCDRSGLATCLDLKTGKRIWRERARGKGKDTAFWGSSVLAGDLIYTVNKSGDGIIFKASPEFELVSANPLGEPSNSTPALSNGQIFIRTHEALWCIE